MRFSFSRSSGRRSAGMRIVDDFSRLANPYEFVNNT